ncbi:MAG: four helix bundle protein [Candidatus Methylomirabilales bacterium]|jgi:four helix bundle protein|nr:four helix bundle protein [candidate division NC10 bacterium]MCH7897537.1 four helix bundle protein [candidate division NC10 bacterium]MCZ6550603.1 four helix bundle protein [candidate division NC10 bacterium]
MAFDFEKLDVYQRAVKFILNVYNATEKFPHNELYGLTAQLRRAAVSIATNIAEGSGRHHKKDHQQFLRMARSSCYECVPLLEVARNLTYMNEPTHGGLYKDCNELAMMLNRFINALNK